MKSVFDPLSMKVLLFICGIMAVIASIIGFSADFQGYVSNLMAEFTGFFIGIILTFLIIDIYNQHNREKQWEKVKNLTFKALSAHLTEIIVQLCSQYHKNRYLEQFIEQRNSPDKEVLALFDRLSAEFNNGNNIQIPFGSFVVFYEVVKPELLEIRKVLIPRIIQSSNKQNIIDSVIEFDDFIMDIEYMIMIHRHVDEKEFCHDCIKNLIENIKNVFAIIVSSSNS